MQWPPGRPRTAPVRAVPAVCYAAGVLVASVTDPPASGLAPSGPLGLVGVDKWFHVFGYAGLAVLLAYALWATTGRRLAVAVGLVVAYGAGIEVIQSFVPLRAFSPADTLANAAGAGLVGLVLWGWQRCVRRGDTATPE